MHRALFSAALWIIKNYREWKGPFLILFNLLLFTIFNEHQQHHAFSGTPLVVISIDSTSHSKLIPSLWTCERSKPQKDIPVCSYILIRRDFSVYKIETHPIRIVLFEKTLFLIPKPDLHKEATDPHLNYSLRLYYIHNAARKNRVGKG